MCECPSNLTTSTPSVLFLVGLSWIQDKALWLAIPLGIMYSVSCLANCTLIGVISLDGSLHKPMYIYISVLAVVVLGESACVIPNVLAIISFDSNTISLEACLAQMFLFHSFQGVEISLFSLMSYDRYVAICHPLRYSSIMTNAFTIKSLLLLITRYMVLLSPLPYLTTRLQYCKSNMIANVFCEHMSFIQLGCGDMTPNNAYMFFLVFVSAMSDFILIGTSYVIILREVLKLASSESRKKALSTCGSHLIVILVCQACSLFTFVMYVFDLNAPLSVQTMSSVLNSLIPPMMNPIVYGVRMKEIQQSTKTLFRRIHHYTN